MKKSEIAPINLRTLQVISHAMMIRGVGYEFGAKAGLRTSLQFIHRIDCSGFVRYVVARSTNFVVALPEGSANQHSYVARYLEPVLYGVVDRPMIDRTLFIAFITPTSHHSGHVWFVSGGCTMESYGGHGVGSRIWDQRPLLEEADACYIWPHLWK